MKFFKGGMDPYEYEIKLLNKNMGSDIETGLDIRYHYDFWVYRDLFFSQILSAMKYLEFPLHLMDLLQLWVLNCLYI